MAAFCTKSRTGTSDRFSEPGLKIRLAGVTFGFPLDHTKTVRSNGALFCEGTLLAKWVALAVGKLQFQRGPGLLRHTHINVASRNTGEHAELSSPASGRACNSLPTKPSCQHISSKPSQIPRLTLTSLRQPVERTACSVPLNRSLEVGFTQNVGMCQRLACSVCISRVVSIYWLIPLEHVAD